MIGSVQGASSVSQVQQTQSQSQPQAAPAKGKPATSSSSTMDTVSISENARQAAADNASAPGGSLVDRDHDGH